ncbi:MAG: BON domain-containing protein [Terracidiphilus sp.]
MNRRETHHSFLGPIAILAGALTIAGCLNGSHPDNKAAIYQSLNSHDLSSVVVKQNREKGVITLSGIVDSPELKGRAEQLAKDAAPSYTIDDKLQVDSAGLQSMITQATTESRLDNDIENRFKASLQTSKNLDKQTIQYSATNGTLYLKGAVRSAREKKEAEELARKVPNVQHVVNEIQVMPGKPSPANS